MLVVIPVATVTVMAGFWLLDQLDIITSRNLRTWLARAALLPILLSMYLMPSTFQAGLDWFVERKTNEVLERFEPLLVPSSSTVGREPESE